MKKVYKYATGQEIPTGAIYLYTREEKTANFIYIWHYFLIEELEKGDEK